MEFFEIDLEQIQRTSENIEFEHFDNQNKKMIIKINKEDLPIFEKIKDVNFYSNYDGAEVIEVDYIDDNGNLMRKFATSGGSLFYKYINYLTKDEIKVSSIKEKNPKEILEKFYNIIDSMEVHTTFKNILKNFFNIDNIIEKTPYLYHNEKDNKDYWYMPDCLNDSIFLEYEKEIPFFVSSGVFLTDYFNISDKSYVIIKKEGMESIVNKLNKRFVYKNYNLPKDFVYYPNRHKLNKESTLFYFNKNEEVSMPCFNFKILDEEQTTQILNITKSDKTLEDIKYNLNYYLNVFKEEKIKTEIIENNPFVGKYYNYNKDYNLKDKYYLSNLFLNDSEIIVDEIQCRDIEVFKNNKYTIELKYNYGYDKKYNTNVFNFNKALIPDDKITKVNKYRNFINQENYTVDNYFIINKKENVFNTKIIEFDEKIEINKQSEKKINNINNNSINQNRYIFHTSKNDLYVINLLGKDFKHLDNVKTNEFNKINEEFKSIIHFEDVNNKNYTDIFILKTNKKLIYIPKQEENSGIDLFEEKKDKDGNYKIKSNISVSKEFNTIFSTLFLNKKNIIKDGEIDGILKNGYEEKYKKIKIEYTFKEKFYETFLGDVYKTKWFEGTLDFLKLYKKTISRNSDFFKDYLKEFKINGISLDKDEVAEFFYMLEVKNLSGNKNIIFKENKNNLLLEIKNITDDYNYYLIKNTKTDINLSCFGDKEFETSDLYKDFVSSKIIDKRYNDNIKKHIYSSKENIYFLNELKFKSINTNFNYDKTLTMKDSIFNNENSTIFYSEKRVALNINKQKEIISFKNTSDEEKLNNLVKSIDISL